MEGVACMDKGFLIFLGGGVGLGQGCMVWLSLSWYWSRHGVWLEILDVVAPVGFCWDSSVVCSGFGSLC
jgi:hypothetical protein